MSELVHLEVEGAVGTIRIDRPPVNALNTQVQQELRAAAEECSRRDDIRAVILWGGEKVFVAGADVKEFHTMSPQDITRRAEEVMSSIDSVAQIPKPVIAAVTGFALGGGCELAMTADFRISADTAKWGQPEILLGIIPGMGGTQRLPRLVGVSKAKDLIYTGRIVDAAEAHEIGLVDVVVEADQVLSTTHAMAAKFAAGPSLALRAAKAAIQQGLDSDLSTGLKLESHLFASLFATEDKQRGIQSFIENGPGKAEFVGN
ncbi:MAG TPA: enoyl-CoA hydratase-related protein [Jatrophihabitans sp.]|jgi:enoyl-CoA hydratase